MKGQTRLAASNIKGGWGRAAQQPPFPNFHFPPCSTSQAHPTSTCKMMSFHFLIVTVVIGHLLFLTQEGQTQMVKQCLCSKVDPCAQSYMGALMPCIDSCQHHLSALGGDLQGMRQCFNQKQDAIQSAFTCTQGQLSNACAKTPGKMVPKRNSDSGKLQVAAIAEINKTIKKMGLSAEGKRFVATGQRIYGCVKTCMAKKSGNCEKKLGSCGLSLPSDNVLVQSEKQCAIQSAQLLCNCAAQAGVKGLDNVCSKIATT